MTNAPLWSGRNPWLYAATAVCTAFWLVAATTSVKLTDIYETRGVHGFRHAIVARIDRRLGWPAFETESHNRAAIF